MEAALALDGGAASPRSGSDDDVNEDAMSELTQGDTAEERSQDSDEEGDAGDLAPSTWRRDGRLPWPCPPPVAFL